MSKKMNCVSTQYDGNVAVVTSLIPFSPTQYVSVGEEFLYFDTEKEAEARFIEIVRSGVHAIGERSLEVLSAAGVQNPPYKKFVK